MGDHGLPPPGPSLLELKTIYEGPGGRAAARFLKKTTLIVTNRTVEIEREGANVCMTVVTMGCWYMFFQTASIEIYEVSMGGTVTRRAAPWCRAKPNAQNPTQRRPVRALYIIYHPPHRSVISRARVRICPPVFASPALRLSVACPCLPSARATPRLARVMTPCS